jgi:hypothetical protein
MEVLLLPDSELVEFVIEPVAELAVESVDLRVTLVVDLPEEISEELSSGRYEGSASTGIPLATVGITHPTPPRPIE